MSGATANAGGKVTYSVYGDGGCTNKVADAGAVTVENGAVPNSNTVKFNYLGMLYWQVEYSGDSNNKLRKPRVPPSSA